MNYRFGVLIAALTLGPWGCRGGGATVGALPPQASQPWEQASSVAFTALGPTHMTSGGIPTSGKVNAIAVDAANPNVIYTAGGRGTGLETYSSAGIYRTTDGGAHWHTLADGLTNPSGVISSVVNALWLDPARPTVVLAATEYDGVFRSTDGGASWQNVYRTTQATQFATFGGTLYASTAAGILASQDD
ncbi:MAG: hypothetical protein JO199_14510, partial [Candidatus Eremiobacteraeota bacterium]|nr:hypothetical protein [Candidatus Eremiobacteraeota bacterium]